MTTTNYSGDATLNIFTTAKTATGTFGTATSVTLSGNFAYNVVTGDFNSDGWPDVAATNLSVNSVSVGLNNGPG